MAWPNSMQNDCEDIMSIAVRAAQLSDLPQLAKMNSCLVDDQGSENPFSLKEYEDRFRECEMRPII